MQKKQVTQRSCLWLLFDVVADLSGKRGGTWCAPTSQTGHAEGDAEMVLLSRRQT